MGSAPDVSLVMPAYRPRSDWLRSAMSSALSEPGCSVELIVVDDGSPEPVDAALAELDDPRLRVIRTERGGPAAARNAGIAVARGRFVRFIDADDVVAPESTGRLLRLATGGPGEAIAYGATLSCDEELRPLRLMSSTLEGWIAEGCLLYRFDVRCMSMLFPSAVVAAVGPWDTALRHCQDWDYVLRALERAPARGMREVATLYRRHPAAQTADLAATLEFEALVVQRYFERHPEQAGTRLERRARAQLLRVRAEHGAAIGRSRRQRARLMREAFALDPPGTVRHSVRLGARASRRLAATALGRTG